MEASNSLSRSKGDGGRVRASATRKCACSLGALGPKTELSLDKLCFTGFNHGSFILWARSAVLFILFYFRGTRYTARRSQCKFNGRAFVTAAFALKTAANGTKERAPSPRHHAFLKAERPEEKNANTWLKLLPHHLYPPCFVPV